ncbi:DUF992 domain-containing protein [Blastochloris viridis]|uniref:DUF992 domain-containing protein n=1 Tax=Blastochloris viridis TaxID=1079 RepID=A0A0H5BCL8_BLAVI|nr:DUF992 domain-containing protein [Blastochloris viridis]ALK08656.1 hypothetical protein BVIR_863 [Blastochloris viridis]BAR98051.1 hypothetical protein BV133_458 [Blastochloris viridis]CUU41319.1 hypothetical protein BVIRIDIS_03080 [Blastochloris viridis]
MKRRLAAAALAVMALTVPQAARAQSHAEVGVLECVSAGGTGFIIGSIRDVTCVFRPGPNQPGRPEQYVGTIRRFGLDIGVTERTVMVWGVLAPSRVIGRGDLVGDYAGVSGQATIGAGVGANVLVGGSNRTISLQPVSVEGSLGLNIAVGVAGLELR